MFVIVAKDGTNRELPGIDSDSAQRLYRYLTSDRSGLRPPPKGAMMWSPTPSNETWDTPWYKGTSLGRLFSLGPSPKAVKRLSREGESPGAPDSRVRV